MAAAIGKHLAFEGERVERLRLAGRVHDLGKIGIRDDVLFKPDHLSQEERNRIRAHPEIAARILEAVPGTTAIAEVVRAHHEHLDGTGYPRGLRGKDVPLEAQALTAADVYCALTEDRPYHARRSPSEALAFLRSWTPAKLTKEVVDALEACVDERADHEAPAPEAPGRGGRGT